MANTNPWILRDFRAGRISKNVVSNFLVPENSVSNSININYDEVIGSAKVRPGTVKLGNTVASNKNPLGLAPFIGPSGDPDYLLAVFASGSSTSTSSSSSSSSSSTISTTSSSSSSISSTSSSSSYSTSSSSSSSSS